MKQLTCEMCGSTDLLKQDGVFVCQTCGTKYSVEEAKKMMVDGTVEVTGSVKVDVSEKVKNLFVAARRAKNDNNAELAAKYYEMITLEDPYNWEASFYFNFFRTKETTLGNMANSVIRLTNSLEGIFDLVTKSDKNADEKWNITKEIMEQIDALCESFVSWAKSNYREFSSVKGSISELDDRANAIADLQKGMADLLEKHFADRSKKERASYLKSYIKNHLLLDTVDRSYVKITLQYYSKELVEAENRIKAIEPDYKSLVDEINKEESDTEESVKGMQNNETSDNAQNNGEMIQVNYQVGHYDISDQWYSSPNSAGGNTVRYAIKNIGTKPIKYYSFCFVPYNAVGDVVGCTISKETEKWVKGTGPIPPNGVSGEKFFENAWYNSSIKSVKLVKAEIEYMDGTKQTIQGDKITSIGNTKSKVFETIGGIIGLILGIVGFETIGFIGLLFAVLIGAGIGSLVDKGNGKNKQTEQREEGNQKNNSDNNKQDQIDHKDDKSEDSHAQVSPKTNKQGKKSKKKIGIICLSAIAVIIALVVVISTFGSKVDSELVGTWRAEHNSSLSITFRNNGDMIVRSSNHVDDGLSYKVEGNTVVVTFADKSKETYGFVVEGDTLIFGEYYYTRVK